MGEIWGSWTRPHRTGWVVGLLGGLVAVLAVGCTDREPDSLFDAAGYHVRGDTVFHLKAFPGSAVTVEGADAATFEALDRTYGRDSTRVYYDGNALPEADPGSFVLLDRSGFARDDKNVHQADRLLSDDPDHFEFLAGDMAKDRAAVYWSDGSILSRDPKGFAIVSDGDHYLFTKGSADVHVNGVKIADANPSSFRLLSGAYSRDDRSIFYFTDRVAEAAPANFEVIDGPYATDDRRVYWMGRVIDGADPLSFRVLNVDFECAGDTRRAYYRQTPIDDTDPATFPDGLAVSGCSATSISFAP
ncbi:DKNYY domain-containing protein [Mycolicibacterium confluentis]|nr:DKNYY domain-containing protein [Mycolicibacterium confluentis]